VQRRQFQQSFMEIYRMNLSISGHHVSVTPALREYVTSKLQRIRNHFDQVIDVNVILSVEKLQQKAEIALHVRGKDLFAECSDADLYAAIDCLVDKLDRQVLKYKDKRHAHPHEALKHQPVAT
jgi:putative sigma-54 modulation protein